MRLSVRFRIWLSFRLFRLASWICQGEIYNQIIKDNEELIDVANASRRLLMNLYEFDTVTDGEFLDDLDSALRRSRLTRDTMPAIPEWEPVLSSESG